MSMSCTKGQLYTTNIAAKQTPDRPDAALIRSIAAGGKHARISSARCSVWRQAGRFQGRSQVTTPRETPSRGFCGGTSTA